MEKGNEFAVTIYPGRAGEDNFFYVEATSEVDGTSFLSSKISFDPVENVDQEPVVNKLGEKEGKMDPSPVLNEDLFEEYDL